MRLTAFRHFALRISLVLLFGVAILPAALRAQTLSASKTLAEAVEIDPNAASHPFPHFWERMFGSGRAILSLREDYRNDLREAKRITDFEYVRFHAIFQDEAGLYDEDASGKPIYNFSYIDQIYDGLLQNKVRPFVELSFMPKKLTSDPNALHAFWYKQNVAPPKDWDKWEQLIENFTRHLVGRYGISKSGMSPTSTSGWAIRRRLPTTSCTIMARAPSSASARAFASAGRPPRKPPGPIVFWRTAKTKTFRSISSQHMSTATIKPRTSSELTSKYRATRWSAVR
jgi:hypothetical protein